MRLFYFVFLLVFGGAAGLLAYENQQDVHLTFFNKEVTTTVPILVGLTYLAGMLSGWTVVGIVRRSLNRVLEEPLPGEYARRR
jgi:4-hydroxybenzoate polyprenyltransferase